MEHSYIKLMKPKKKLLGAGRKDLILDILVTVSLLHCSIGLVNISRGILTANCQKFTESIIIVQSLIMLNYTICELLPNC